MASIERIDRPQHPGMSDASVAVDPQPYAAVFAAAAAAVTSTKAAATDNAAHAATEMQQTSETSETSCVVAATATAAAAVATAAAVAADPLMPPPTSLVSKPAAAASVAKPPKLTKKGGKKGATAGAAKKKAAKATSKRTTTPSALEAGFASAAAAAAATLAPTAAATSAAAPVASSASPTTALPKSKRLIVPAPALVRPLPTPIDPFAGAGVSLLAAHRSDGSASACPPPPALSSKSAPASAAVAYSPPVLIAAEARPHRLSLPSLSLPSAAAGSAAAAAAAAPALSAPLPSGRIDLTSPIGIDLSRDPDGCEHPMLDSSGGEFGSVRPSSPACLLTRRPISPATTIRGFAAAHSITPEECFVSHAGPLEFVDPSDPSLGVCPPLTVAQWRPYVSRRCLVVEEWSEQSQEEQLRAFHHRTLPKTCPKQLEKMRECFVQMFSESPCNRISAGMQRYRHFRPKHAPTTIFGHPSPLHPYIDFNIIARKLDQAAYAEPSEFAQNVTRFWEYVQLGLRSDSSEWEQAQACATHCANLTHQCLVSINRMEAEERKLLFDQHRAKQREADISNGCKASHDHDGPAYAQPGHVSERGAQDQIAIELFRCTREQELCDAIREEHDRQKTKPPTRWEEKRGVVWKGQLLKAPTFSPPVPLNSPLSMSLSPPIVPSDAATAAAAAATVPHAPATIVKDFLALSETDDDETSDCEIRPPRTQRAASVNVDTDGFLAATPAKRAADRFEETKEAAGIQPQSRMPNSAAAVPFIPAPSASSLLVDDSGPCPMELGDRDEQPRQPRALSSDGPVEDTPGPTEAAEVKVPESSMSMPESYVSSYDQVLRHYSQAPCVRAWSQEQQQRFFQFATVVHDPNQRERLEQIKKDEAYAVYFENLSLVQAEIQQWMLQQQTFGKGESSAVALANELGEFGNGTDKHGAASPSGPVLAGAAAADPVYKAVHVKRRLARRTSESAVAASQAAAAASSAASGATPAVAPATPRRSSRPSTLSFKAASLSSEFSEEPEQAEREPDASARTAGEPVSSLSADSSTVVSRVRGAYLSTLTEKARTCKRLKLAQMAKMAPDAYAAIIARLQSTIFAILVDRRIPEGQREARLREYHAELKSKAPKLSGQEPAELELLQAQLGVRAVSEAGAAATSSNPATAAAVHSNSSGVRPLDEHAPKGVPAPAAAAAAPFSKRKRKQAEQPSVPNKQGGETDEDETPLTKAPRFSKKKTKSSAASSVASVQSTRKSSRNGKPMQVGQDGSDEITNEQEEAHKRQMQGAAACFPSAADSSTTMAAAAAGAPTSPLWSDSAGVTLLKALIRENAVDTDTLSPHMELNIYQKLEVFGRDYEQVEALVGTRIKRDLTHYLRRWEKAGVPLPSAMLRTGASYTVKPTITDSEEAAELVDDASDAEQPEAAAFADLVTILDTRNDHSMVFPDAHEHDDAWSAAPGTGHDEERHSAVGNVADVSDGRQIAIPRSPLLEATSPTVIAHPAPMDELEHAEVESIALPASVINSAPSTPATRTLGTVQQPSEPSKPAVPAELSHLALEPISIPAAAPVTASTIQSSAPLLAAQVWKPFPMLQPQQAQQYQAAFWQLARPMVPPFHAGALQLPLLLPSTPSGAIAPAHIPLAASQASTVKTKSKSKSKSKKISRAPTLQAEFKAFSETSSAAGTAAREARAAARARSAAASPASATSGEARRLK